MTDAQKHQALLKILTAARVISADLKLRQELLDAHLDLAQDVLLAPVTVKRISQLNEQRLAMGLRALVMKYPKSKYAL